MKNYNEKIRVLIVGSDISVKGGITSVIKRYLNQNFKDISISYLPTYIEAGSVRKISFFISSYFKYISKLIKNKFDIVHIHMSYKGSFYRKLLIIIISKIFKKKIILHIHGSEFKLFYDNGNLLVKSLIRYALRSSNVVITLGDRWNKAIKEIESESNSVVLKNAVKIPKYRVHLNKDKFNIVFLGVLIKRKGIYELIEAIKTLKDGGIVKRYNLHFLIGGSGPEEEKIKKLVNKYELNEFVEMLGWIDSTNKADILKKSNLMILPSYNEGLPMAILEAMSYGIPVVSTDVGSISEVVNNRNGCIIEPKKPEEIVKGIKSILKHLDNWEKYSEEAKKVISENFNENKYFYNVESLYKEVMMGR